MGDRLRFRIPQWRDLIQIAIVAFVIYRALLFLLGTGQPKFNHAAFEVVDLDDLMKGHDLLKQKSYEHQWGIGRHVLGSQIFDYWRDPWGHTLEHWTDGDLMTADWGSREATLQDLTGVQWGMQMPPNMG